MNRAELNKVHTKVFEAVSEVHSFLGPGLDNPVYKSALLHELRHKGLLFKKDVVFPLSYKLFKAGELVIEVLIENNIILQIIRETEITDLHLAGLQSKLKHTGLRMGIIVTFNTLNIIEGYRKVLFNQ